MAEGETAPQLRSWTRQGIDVTGVLEASAQALLAARSAQLAAEIAENAARIATNGATNPDPTDPTNTGGVQVAQIIDATNLMRTLLRTAGTQAEAQTQLGAAARVHKHDVTDLNTTSGAASASTVLYGDGSWRVPSGVVAGSVAWADVTGKPSSFVPSAHTQPISSIDTLEGRLQNLDGLPPVVTDLQTRVSAIESGSSGGRITLAALPAGSMISAIKDPTTGFWPASWATDGTPVYTGGSASTGTRPTSRSDVVVNWIGPGADPPIVASGVGGMRDFDLRSRTAAT